MHNGRLTIPKHEWDGTKLRLQKSNGEMGEWVDLRGADTQNTTFIKEQVDMDAAIAEILAQIPKPRPGVDGEDGKDGKDGKDGEDGLSAYEVWLSVGHRGTEDDFFNWLADKVKAKIALDMGGAGPLRLKLDNLSDVDTEGAVTGNALVFNGTEWAPGAGGGGGSVVSVNGQDGIVVLDTGDIADVTDKRYVTDAQRAIIQNTSGVNTGDQDLSGYLLTSTALTTFVPQSQLGMALGVATLDSMGTIPMSQIPQALLGATIYQGTWNATTNTPTLVSSTGTKGFYYIVDVAGATNLDGITDWKLGDWAIFNGTVWQKVDNTDAVQSVNGKMGTVVLDTSDINDTTNRRYVTDANLAILQASTALGLGAANQIRGVNAGATAEEFKTFLGTLNRLTLTYAPNAVTFDISANYVGQPSITTLGTITTGTWNGTAIGADKGGTGQTGPYTNGQILIGNTTTGGLNPATITGTTNQVGVTNGAGSITLFLPQDIASSSTPTFSRLGVGQSAIAAAKLNVSGTLSALINTSPSMLNVSGTITEFTSGTHPLITGAIFQPPAITAGAATLTNAATVYITNQTAGVVTGANYSLYVAAGQSRFDGNVGIGIVPISKFHVSDGNTLASALVSTDYQVISGQDSSIGSSIVVADNATAGNRATFKGVRSRGTLGTPLVPANGDDVLSFLGAIYDGSTTQGTAMVGFVVDGTVTAGNAPQKIGFYTSPTTGGGRVERMTIKNDGKVGIGTITPNSKAELQTNALGAYSVANVLANIASGFQINNTTPATSTVNQMSPVFRQSTQGWALTGPTTRQVDSTLTTYGINGALPAPVMVLQQYANNTLVDANFQIVNGAGVYQGGMKFVGNDLVFYQSNFGNHIYLDNFGKTELARKVYVGGTTAAAGQALLHIAAGTIAALSAPIKFTSGPLMTTPETGALEYDGTHLYLTVGTTRRALDQHILAVSSKTATYQVVADDEFLRGDATAGNMTFTLPTAVGITGKTYIFKKIDSSINTVTIATTSSQTIDGATTNVIITQYAVIRVVSNGANWDII